MSDTPAWATRLADAGFEAVDSHMRAQTGIPDGGLRRIAARALAADAALCRLLGLCDEISRQAVLDGDRYINAMEHALRDFKGGER
jgi:hypothetical protein